MPLMSSRTVNSGNTNTTSVIIALSGLAIASIGIVFAFPQLRVGDLVTRKKETTDSGSKQQHHSKKKRERGSICPYSAETNFLVEEASNVPPTPLDLFESWTDPQSPDYGRPLAARWLNAGISGQDTPGILRAGLKRLPNSKYFLLEEPIHMKHELLLKQQAFDDPQLFAKYYAAEEDSFDAQMETLELFLSYLPKRYPELYKYDEKAGTIHVVLLEKTFMIDEWVKKGRPLELLERIVQEDLILMRPPKPTDDFDQYAMAAAAVIFSFTGIPEKLGKPVMFIHAPVPGYSEHLKKTLDLTFSKLLKVEQPMWRNNWGISPSGNLVNPVYGSRLANSQRALGVPTREDIKAKFLKVEYQTIRRLPKTKYLLFTVRTLLDPMESLEEVPNAARCLAGSIRGLSKGMREYKGIGDDETCNAVLSYLDSISSNEEKA